MMVMCNCMGVILMIWQLSKEKCRFATSIVGRQCARTTGTWKILLFFVDSWDTLLGVRWQSCMLLLYASVFRDQMSRYRLSIGYMVLMQLTCDSGVWGSNSTTIYLVSIAYIYGHHSVYKFNRTIILCS